MEHVTQPEVPVVDQLRRDTLTIHVGEAKHRVVQSVVVVAVSLLNLGQAAGAALRTQQEDGSRVDLIVRTQRREQLVIALVEVVRPELLWNARVRI